MRKPVKRRALVIVAAAGTALALACGSSDSRDNFEDAPDAAPTSLPNNPAPPTPQGGEVFGQSDDMLFRVDTLTHDVQKVGYFQGCTHVADIALDADSNMYASTGAGLYLIETNTGRCSLVKTGAFPNSLSFVPAGTLDFGSETLVGYQGGDYVKIDTKTGTVTKIGSLGGGFDSSGDIVSAKGGKTFVSVKGPNCADCLIEVDPKTGAAAKNWGPIGKPDVFGLAFWAGDVYAFTNTGDLLLVTFNGDAITSTPIPIPNAPPGLAFRGAGSSTSAPIGPVH
jgi:hypothetical protein